MHNDQKFSKPVNPSVNTSDDILRERRESFRKPSDGTMTFMVWSFAGTVLAACSGGFSFNRSGDSDATQQSSGPTQQLIGTTTQQSGPANNGTFQDGPVRGARFFINRNGDENGDVVYDEGVDISLGVTNALGNADFGEYSINIGDVVFVDATGAIDIATGGILSGVWKSLPYDGSGEILVSPLTDLLSGADDRDDQQTMLNDIFGEGVITVDDILNRDNYNPFDDELEAQLISRAAIALTEIEVHHANDEPVPDLAGVFATYRAGGLINGDVPLDNVSIDNDDNERLNLKAEIDARLTAAEDRGDVPVVVDPNGGEPIRIMEDEEVRVADLLSSYATSAAEGSAEEYLFGFEDPLGSDNLEGVFIQAESVDSEGNPTFAYVRFRQDDGTVVRLADAPADERGVPSNAPEDFDKKQIDGQELYYVSADNIHRLILEPGAGVEGDFGIRYYVYDGGLVTEGDGILDIAVDSTNDAPTAIMASDTELFVVIGDSMPDEDVLVTTFTTADSDEDDTHTYTITGDDAGHFKLDGNTLFFSPNFGEGMPVNELEIVITSTDSEGASVSQSFTIQGLSAPTLVAGADLDLDVVSGTDTVASGEITQLTSDRIHLFGSGSGDDYFVSSSDTTNDQTPDGTVLTGTYGNMYLRTDGSWDYQLTSDAYTLAGRTGRDTFQVRYQFGGEASGPAFDIDIAVEGPPALTLSAPTGNPEPVLYHASGRSHTAGGTFQGMLDGQHVVAESDLTYGIGLTEEAALARLEGGGASHERFNDGAGRFTISDTGTWSYTLFDPAPIEEKANNIDAFYAGSELVVQKIWVAARTQDGEVGAVEVDVPIKGLTVVEGSGGRAGTPPHGEGGARSTLRSDADSDVKLLLGTGLEQGNPGITFRGPTSAGRDTITANGDAGDVNLIFANTNYDTINLDSDTTDIIYHRIQTGPGPRRDWVNVDGADTINRFRRGQDKIVFVDVDALLPEDQQGAAGFRFNTHIRDTYIDFSALIDRTRDSVDDPYVETIIGFEIDFRTDNTYGENPGHGNIKVFYHDDHKIVTGSSEVHNRYYGNHLGDYSAPRGGGQGNRHIGDNSKWQNYFGEGGFEVVENGLLPPAVQAEIDRHIDSTGQFVVESTQEGRLEHDVVTDGDLFYGIGLTEQAARDRLDGSSSHERFNDGAGILTISDTGTYSYTLHTRGTIEAKASNLAAFRAGHEVVVQTLWVAVRAPNGEGDTVQVVQVDVPITGLNVVEGPGGSQLNVVNDQGQSGAELLLGTGYGEIRPGSVAGDAYRGRDEINVDGPPGDTNLIFANTHADTINLHSDTTDIIYHRIQTGSHDLGNPNVESANRHGWRNVDGGDTINGFRRGQDKIVFVDIDGLLPEEEQGTAEFDFNADIRNRYIDFYALVEWTGTHEEIIGFQIHFKTDNGDGLFPGHGDIKVFYDNDHHVVINNDARHLEFFGEDVGDMRSFSGRDVGDVNSFTPGDEYREIHDYSKWGRYFGLAEHFGTNGYEFVHTGLLPAGIAAEVARHIDPDTEQYAAGEGAATFTLTAPMGTPRPAQHHVSGRSYGGTFQGRLNNDVVAAGDLKYAMGLTEEAALASLEEGNYQQQFVDSDGTGRFTISDAGTWSYTLHDVAPVEEKAHNLDAFRAGNELVVQTIWVAARSPDGGVDAVEVDVPIKGLTVVEGSGGVPSTSSSDVKLLLGTGFPTDSSGNPAARATFDGRETITANGDSGDVNLIFANTNIDTINLDEDTTDIVYHRIQTRGLSGGEWRNIDGGDTINGFKPGQDKIVFVDEADRSGFHFLPDIGHGFLDFYALVERTRNDEGELVEMITGFQIGFTADQGFGRYPGYGDIRVYYHEDHKILAHGHAFHEKYFGLYVDDVEHFRGGQEYRFIYDTSKWQNYFGDDGFELVENGLLPTAVQAEIDRHIDPMSGEYVEEPPADVPMEII